MAAGTRAYSVGFEDGRFYANGWHITGEMGGIWAPPLKLADGVWFGIDDEWVGPATKFTSGRGYVRYTLPPIDGLLTAPHRLRPRRPPRRAVRPRARQPDGGGQDGDGQGRRALRAAGRLPVGVDDAVRPSDNLTDIAPTRTARWRSRDRGTLPGGQPQDYTALVASTRAADAGETGPGFRGPQPGAVCKDGDKPAPSGVRRRPVRQGRRAASCATASRSARARRRRCGSPSPAPTAASRRAQASSLRRSRTRTRSSRAKTAERDELAARSRRRPARATASCRRRSTGASRTSPTSRRPRPTCGSASSTRARRTRRRSATSSRVTFIGAGYPDYPWLFATDGEYTAFAAVALGQFEADQGAPERAARGLRRCSTRTPARSRTRSSPTARSTSAPTRRRQHGRVGQVPERRRARLALDRRRPLPRPPLRLLRRAMRYVTDKLDADKDGWPEGLGNVERDGHGRRRSSTTPST